MIEIYLLEQFVAFANSGTLSKAAEALHISQPALSRSMKKLEETLGVALFEREKSKVALNETGLLAAKLAEEQLQQNESMIRRIQAFDRSRRSITVGACAPYPMNELMPILQEHFGGMLLTSELADMDQIEQSLRAGAYQIGILNRPTAADDLFCQRFVSEHLYISVPRTHRLAGNEQVTFGDLAGERILLFEHIGFWKDVCREKMTGASFLVQSSMDALEELIAVTDYPCFTTDAFLHQAPLSQDRVIIPIEEPAAYATFYVACQSADKRKYASFFNAIRARTMQG